MLADVESARRWPAQEPSHAAGALRHARRLWVRRRHLPLRFADVPAFVAVPEGSRLPPAGADLYCEVLLHCFF